MSPMILVQAFFLWLLTKILWQQITGKQGDELDNIHIEASAHGNSISLIGSQIQEELFLSNHTLGYPKAYFAVDNFNGLRTQELMESWEMNPFMMTISCF